MVNNEARLIRILRTNIRNVQIWGGWMAEGKVRATREPRLDVVNQDKPSDKLWCFAKLLIKQAVAATVRNF